MEKIIDAHCLCGRDYWLSENKPVLVHENNLLEYENEIKSIASVYHSMIMPFPSSTDGTYILENDIILRINQQKKWTTPVLAFNPNSTESFNYICSKLEIKQADSIVLWPILCNLDLKLLAKSDRLKFILENYKCMVTVHVGAGNEQDIKRVVKLNNYSPMDAINLAESFPYIRFNLSHLLRISVNALKAAERLDNVIIDISGLSTHKNWYEHGINVFPSYDSGRLKEMSANEILSEIMKREKLRSKLVFGSQYPFGKWYGFDLKKEISIISKSKLSDKERRMLMYQNFEDFMGRSYT